MFINQNKHQDHLFFMKLALSQAQRNLGNTNENPSVGCVITKNNMVISAACTSIKGRPHAEHNAIKLSRTNLEGRISMAKCSPKASKKGRLVIKLVHKETGEFYTTTINDKIRKEEQKEKLSLMKYSRKLRKKVKFSQEKA